jgi:hypothetical protein
VIAASSAFFRGASGNRTRVKRREIFAEGLHGSVRENETAYGFSIMITATFGVLSALDASPSPSEVFLFAFAAVAGFTTVSALAHFTRAGSEAEGTQVLLVASFLNFASVLAGVGAAALVSWAGHGWAVWTAGPFAGSVAYMVVNALEYAIAAEADSGR